MHTHANIFKNIYSYVWLGFRTVFNKLEKNINFKALKIECIGNCWWSSY